MKDNEDLKEELDMDEQEQLKDVIASLRGHNSNTDELEKRWVLHGKRPGIQCDYDLPADTLVTANQPTLTELWGAQGETEFVPTFVAAKRLMPLDNNEIGTTTNEWQQKIREDMKHMRRTRQRHMSHLLENQSVMH